MSPTALTTSTPDWKSLEGTVLDGGYELREILEADAESASYRVRVLGDYSRRALARFYVAEGDGAEDQLAIWETLRELRDENLSTALGCGSRIVDEIRTEYAVLPAPDETLAGVLSERALTEQETREVMTIVVRALEKLHASGLVHGRVSPEEIVAAGPAIQLTTTCVRRINSLPNLAIRPGKYLAPESVEQNTTTAADVWCLGATLTEALVRTPYAVGTDIESLELSPAFKRVLTACLAADPHRRCALADLPELYRQAPASSASAAPVPPPTSSSNTKPVALAAAAATQNAPQAPAPTLEAASLPPVETGTQPHTGMYDGPILVTERPAGVSPQRVGAAPNSRAWLYGGLGVLVLFVIFLFARGRHTPKQPSVTKEPPAAAIATPANNDWPTRTLSPDSTAAKRPSTAATPGHSTALTAAPHPNGTMRGSIWRVVLYTYARESDAQKKAQSLNEKHTGLGAEVFSPNGAQGPYLVVAGGKMTRDEALQMRKTALRMGMPHDSYIQNYNQ